MKSGSYKGTFEDLVFEFRVEHAAAPATDAIEILSGDIYRAKDYVASFVCSKPQLSADGIQVSGPIFFRGNPELFTGEVLLETDARGTGSFKVSVDVEEGHRDIFAGRLDWQGSVLRRLSIEIDGIAGATIPTSYKNRAQQEMSISRAFELAGFDARVQIDPFVERPSSENRTRGYTLAEIHTAMQRTRSNFVENRINVHVFVCSFLSGRDGRNVLGVMYDFDQYDLNRRPREGVAIFSDHPMLSDPRVPEQVRNREFVYTAVHEIGHSLNLLHSFDKARPSALSWMNYPDLYPFGETRRGYDGTDEFWKVFDEKFELEELRHLRHGTPREVLPGGFAFGVYESDTHLLTGRVPSPSRTRLGANPLRRAQPVLLKITPLKRAYELGEPVFLKVEVSNNGPDSIRVPDALDPSQGHLRVIITDPTGRTYHYKPPVKFCRRSQMVHLAPGGGLPPFDGLPLFLSADGPLFTQPGAYSLVAELSGIEGSRNTLSAPVPLTILIPDPHTEAFAHEWFTSPGAQRALYLRHPLTDRNAWGRMEEAITKRKLRPGNTTAHYMNYIAGLGWLDTFAPPDFSRPKEANLDQAATKLKGVNPAHLPSSVKNRQLKVLSAAAAKAPSRHVATSRQAIPTRPAEEAREEIAPAGLFGSAGLLPITDVETPLDPFVRIVPTLRGKKAFADIVSWNIEHLHSEAHHPRIPKIAKLIRSFRCDFWGLQEVDEVSLRLLVETLNSVGNVRYDYLAISGKKGQHSGAIYRTDTTSVRRLEAPEGFFDEEIPVTDAKTNKIKPKPVFYRPPLLCEVRVVQESGALDFRCAIVHLKSTDTSLKDQGNALRAHAANELARWMKHDRELSGGETDYLIMGDMNAETVNQGLTKALNDKDLKLLTVGMREEYGAEALTRVASGRLLDHIVITSDSVPKMPKEDIKEQLIIRSDTQISTWTREYSDHIPVAVRFVISKDAD